MSPLTIMTQREALRTLYDALADCCAYPTPHANDHLRRCTTAFALCRAVNVVVDPAAYDTFGAFRTAIEAMPVADREELYTRTFDVNPVASLDCGWHLYGEQYERGAFLVRMRDTLRRLGVEETMELPDHLTQLLRALGRMEETEAASFTANAVGPAVQKILDGLSSNENAYTNLIRSVAASLPQVPAATIAEKSHV